MRGRFGNDVSLCTIKRWTTTGVRGAILESLKIGTAIYTSEEATFRFLEKLNSPRVTNGSRAGRSRAVAAADRRLDDAGV
jgi:hypothetical protein